MNIYSDRLRLPYLMFMLTAVYLSGCATSFAEQAAQVKLPELPREYVDTTYTPPQGKVHRVRGNAGDPELAGDALQEALKVAQLGDTIELEAGKTYAGNFTLPYKNGTGWIYIRSSAYSSLPPPGTRVTPSHAKFMAKIISMNLDPVFTTRAGAHHYRFVGVEITTEYNSTENLYLNLVLLQCGGVTCSEIGMMPTDIIFDRCYVHGTPKGNIRRAIAMNGKRMAVVDSYISDIHTLGTPTTSTWYFHGNDSHAIGGWAGPGPFKIVNNYLEGSHQNVWFGLSRAAEGVIPSDIEIRRNHMLKPLSWKPGHPNYGGIPWLVKENFELKAGRRVLIEGNVFENNWVNTDHNGYAILFTVRNDNGKETWSVIEDVTFQHNKILHAGGGINILGHDDSNESGQAARILIRNNLFEDINSDVWGKEAHGQLVFVINGASDVVFEHNTSFQNDYMFRGHAMKYPTNAGFVFRNNITNYGSGWDMATFENYEFRNNIMIDDRGRCRADGTNACATNTAIHFMNKTVGNYRLSPESGYKKKGTDGNDIGADIDALEAAIGSAIGGDPRNVKAMN